MLEPVSTTAAGTMQHRDIKRGGVACEAKDAIAHVGITAVYSFLFKPKSRDLPQACYFKKHKTRSRLSSNCAGFNTFFPLMISTTAAFASSHV